MPCHCMTALPQCTVPRAALASTPRTALGAVFNLCCQLNSDRNEVKDRLLHALQQLFSHLRTALGQELSGPAAGRAAGRRPPAAPAWGLHGGAGTGTRTGAGAVPGRKRRRRRRPCRQPRHPEGWCLPVP